MRQQGLYLELFGMPTYRNPEDSVPAINRASYSKIRTCCTHVAIADVSFLCAVERSQIRSTNPKE